MKPKDKQTDSKAFLAASNGAGRLSARDGRGKRARSSANTLQNDEEKAAAPENTHRALFRPNQPTQPTDFDTLP